MVWPWLVLGFILGLLLFPAGKWDLYSPFGWGFYSPAWVWPGWHRGYYHYPLIGGHGFRTGPFVGHNFEGEHRLGSPGEFGGFHGHFGRR